VWLYTGGVFIADLTPTFIQKLTGAKEKYGKIDIPASLPDPYKKLREI
jgi:hypothetical protein